MTTGLVSVEGTLDRLQEQVEGGTCRIASACSRLENLIQSLCKDDMTRPFLSVMGRILNLLFGDDVRAGWIETAVDNDSLSALYHLLEPHGAVFSAAWHYSITEGVSHYELSTLAVLPVHRGSRAGTDCIGAYAKGVAKGGSQGPSKAV